MNRFAWLLALALAGCGPAVPGGQVVAVVNGDDVTMRDLTGTGSVGAAPDRALLEQVIDRHLLAEEALARGIDRSPEYLASLRNLREQLLVQALGRQLAAGQPAASAEDVTAYIAAHPHSFGQRVQVDLTTGQDGTAFTLDTVELSPDQASLLASRRPGDSFNYDGTSYTVAGRRAVPLTGDDARDYGQQAIAAERVRTALRHILADKRARASISYQEGLGPAAK